MTDYYVYVDDALLGIVGDVETARAEAKAADDGTKLLRIEMNFGTAIPMSAEYWDSEVKAWVHVANAVLAPRVKPRG